MTSYAAAIIGVAFGLRHAFEPDHLAAVSTVASEHRGALAATRVGLWWGLGHALTLLLLGGTLSLLELQMPEAWSTGLELAVAVMVVGLGLRAVWRAAQEGRHGPVQVHAHGGKVHAHAADGSHLHISRWVFATRPLLIGAMHGLAGSGALTAIVLLNLPSPFERLLYITLFGLGAALGMGGLTALYGLPLGRIGLKAPKLASAVLALAGLASVGIGLWWGFGAAVKLSS